MAKKRTTGEPVNITVVFVEGDADELLINKLLFFYRNKGWTGCCKIKNTHGFPDEKKMRQGLKSIELCSKKM